mmetsp:Transcript_34108/g.63243  ORF Transcript_34108/g.63243 Transcript_34108/m.63243 type:complete len:85 (-) Transcript_34108:41-295(-)
MTWHLFMLVTLSVKLEAADNGSHRTLAVKTPSSDDAVRVVRKGVLVRKGRNRAQGEDKESSSGRKTGNHESEEAQPWRATSSSW